MSCHRYNNSRALPLEIVERILGDVNDHKDLKTCSLISKNFLHPSQKLLFQTVKLSLVPDTKALCHTSPPNTATQIMDFLISSPNHSSMVSNIHIWGGDVPVEATTTSDWSSTIHSIGILLLRLTHLRHVKIESSLLSDWTMLNGDLKNALLGFYTLPTLQHLELHYTSFSDDELATFSRIPRLTLLGVNLCPTLDLKNHKLFSKKWASTVELKVVLRGSEAATQCMLDIVNATRETLKRLSWHTSPYLEDDNYILPKMTLSDFPFLVFFSICIPVGSSTIDDLVLMFGHREGARLRLKTIELIFDCETLSNDIVATWDWTGLDALLSSPTYQELENLCVAVKKKILYGSSRAGDDTQTRGALSLFRSHLLISLGKGVNIKAMTDLDHS